MTRRVSLNTQIKAADNTWDVVEVKADELASGCADGTLQKLMSDPSLYNNIDAASCQVLKMMPQLNRILEDFGTFADKLARHPEKLGLGGAVRPSDGLKSPPTPPLPPPGLVPQH